MINVIFAIAKSWESENGLFFNPFHIRNSLEQEFEALKPDERKTEMGIERSDCLALAIARHNCSAVDGGILYESLFVERGLRFVCWKRLEQTFSSAHISPQYEPISSHFMYFSFVTMTTLGLGDMIPVGSLAKSLVVFQGMIELLYLVIMIARLVSMEVAHSTLEKRNSLMELKGDPKV